LDLEAQCRALLLRRMYVQNREEGRMTAVWLESWGLDERQQNLPNANRTLKHLVYLYTCATDMAYIKPPTQHDSLRIFRKGIYTTLHTMALATQVVRDMRVVQLHPDTHWTKAWNNLHTAWVSEEIKAVWHTAIHDVIPIHVRLAKIRLRASNPCNQSGRTDTIQHRLTECTDGADMWMRTRSQIATILCTTPTNVRPEWTVHPCFHFWAPQRHRAV
jgi:hypothetical protein